MLRPAVLRGPFASFRLASHFGIAARDDVDRCRYSSSSGTVDIIAGGYAEWEARRKEANGPRKTAVAAKREPSKPAAAAVKLTYKDQRDYDLLPDRISALEAEIADLEEALGDAGLYTKDRAKFDRLTARNSAALAEKEAAEERWLTLAEQVEAMELARG
ncbi:MAG: ABC transporter C-terminal domain-containing protein [Parasphingorhabdus sp.]|nr:ABC transporter C-terminal domain-containing protein [Parasphingorhabdus sp.]